MIITLQGLLCACFRGIHGGSLYKYPQKTKQSFNPGPDLWKFHRQFPLKICYVRFGCIKKGFHHLTPKGSGIRSPDQTWTTVWEPLFAPEKFLIPNKCHTESSKNDPKPFKRPRKVSGKEKAHKLRDGPKYTVSETTVSNTKLSERSLPSPSSRKERTQWVPLSLFLPALRRG